MYVLVFMTDKKEMFYSEIVDVYEDLLGTSGKLEKASILADFLKKLDKIGEDSRFVYLLRGKVVPDYDSRELGISRQLALKAISKGFGVSQKEVEKEFRKTGDLGGISEHFAGKRKQGSLFSKKLTIRKVFDNLSKLLDIEGKGTVGKKMDLVGELLGQAEGKEAKYIIRTVLGDLKVGVADGIMRDGIAEAFFYEEDEMRRKIEEAYDMANDFALVFDSARKGKKELGKIGIVPGRPLNVMLPVKVTEIEEGFRIVGKPAALEHKYDGFRVVISKDEKGNVKLFTRKLEEVTNQFPDVVSVIKKNVKGKSFMLDSEVVGFDRKTEKYMPFESISQRIRRKYDIDNIVEKLPVEVNVFDVLYLDGESLLDLPFKERRKVIEKIIKTERLKIRTSFQLVTDDLKEAEKFYKEALKIGEEGIMFKALDKEYRQGRRVGYIVKLKPAVNDLDLVITGAEYGSGKRGGLLTSYIVACRNSDNGNGKTGKEEFVDVGKVASGLKEIENESGDAKEGEITYKEMDALLRPLIEKEEGSFVKVKEKIVVSVTYQNIQGSPSYNSGFAMRFPRITAYRPDRNVKDIADLKDIKREFKRGIRSRKDTLG